MIDLGSTSFYLDAPVMSREDLQAYSTRLFEAWDARLAQELDLPDYAVTLEIEEGSLSGLGTVTVAAGVLLSGIVTYGGLINGLEVIRRQIRAAGDYLADRSSIPFVTLHLRPRVRRRSGNLGQLQRLFGRVQRREMTPEEALQEAETFLGNDAKESTEFMGLLDSTLRSIPQIPEQLVFPLDLPEDVAQISEAPNELGVRARSKPAAPPPKEKWRVEVWRDSRTGKRQVRVTEI